MAEIHPISPDEPSLHFSPIKVAIFTIIVLGIGVLGIVSRNRPTQLAQTTGTQVLGEGTQTLESYLPEDVKKTVSYAQSQNGKMDPETLLQTGKDMVASAAESLASQAGAQSERMASDAAKNVSDFVYKNTIERIIDSLIQSLPVDRQKQYSR